MAQPAQTLTPTTRMAIQAAIAVTLAILFGHYFQFERAYWAILTTMVLVCQTWGESVRKSITRIGMTIVGGITGTLIYFWVKDYHLLFICLLGCIFFAVFFLETSYLWVVFFLTNLVVFLFALLQSWNVKLLAARIEETFISAVIAIATTALILPTRAKTQLATDLPNFVKLAAELTDDCLAQFLGHKKASTFITKKRTRLLKAFMQLSNHAKTISYEVFFTTLPQQRLKAVLLELNVMTHYVTSLTETLSYLSNSDTFAVIMPDLIEIRAIIKTNFGNLSEHFSDHATAIELNTLDDAKQAIFNKINASIQRDDATKEDWFEFYSFLYFLRRINDSIRELIKY